MHKLELQAVVGVSANTSLTVTTQAVATTLAIQLQVPAIVSPLKPAIETVAADQSAATGQVFAPATVLPFSASSGTLSNMAALLAISSIDLLLSSAADTKRQKQSGGKQVAS